MEKAGKILMEAASFTVGVEPTIKTWKRAADIRRMIRTAETDRRKELVQSLVEDHISVMATALALPPLIVSEYGCIGVMAAKSLGVEIPGTGADWAAYYLLGLALRAIIYGHSKYVYESAKTKGGE
jgi:hypothetical protein